MLLSHISVSLSLPLNKKAMKMFSGEDKKIILMAVHLPYILTHQSYCGSGFLSIVSCYFGCMALL